MNIKRYRFKWKKIIDEYCLYFSIFSQIKHYTVYKLIFYFKLNVHYKYIYILFSNVSSEIIIFSLKKIFLFLIKKLIINFFLIQYKIST
jgi:hypothetical protein